MVTIVMWIIVIVVFALIAASWEEQQKRRKAIEDLRRAKDDFLKALSQGSIATLLAYGSFLAPPAEAFESAQESGTGALEAELIWRETEKWSVMDFGASISTALLELGALTLVFAPNGSITVESSKNPAKPFDYMAPSLPEPFIPKDFRLTQPSPETATLTYKVTSGYKTLNACSIWAKRGQHWVTVSYRIDQG